MPLQREIDAAREEDPRKPGLLLRMADLLFHLGSLDPGPSSQRYCDAAPLFTQVVKRDPKGIRLGDAAQVRDASFGAVQAWTRCLDIPLSGDDGRDRAGRARWEQARRKERAAELRSIKEPDFAPRPIPERQQRMLESFDTYLRYVPAAPQRLAIRYWQACVLYQYHHLEEAIPLFRDIVENHATSELAVPSANLLLGCLSMRKDDAGVRRQIQMLKEAPDLLRDQAFAMTLAKIDCQFQQDIEEKVRKGAHREAGILYRQLAERCAADPHLDELYFNAAASFERAGLMGLTIEALEKLIQVRPKSPLLKSALGRLGRAYKRTAVYDKAAEKYEEYASKYPDERVGVPNIEARWALQTAAFLRRALGQDDRSIADVRLFLKNYGSHTESFDQAAGLFFEMGQIYEQRPDKLKAHLEEYLRAWGQKGGIDRVIIAEVKLGAIAWQRSCPVAGVHGACVELLRQPGPCGGGTGSKFIVHERAPALAREAMAHFQKALRLYAMEAAGVLSAKDPPSARVVDVGKMTSFAAQARMMQGDREYEKLLAMKVPAGLSFGPDDKRSDEDRRRLRAFIESRARQMEEAEAIYKEVILFKSAPLGIAASARIGQLFQGLVCDALKDGVGPLKEKAEEAFSACLRMSTESGWFGEWSQLCERELNQIKPRDYPLALEIHAQPGTFSPQLDVDAGRLKDATDHIDAAIHADPWSAQAVQAYTNKGALLLSRARLRGGGPAVFAEAIDSLRHALAVDATSVQAHQLLALIYYLTAEQDPSRLQLALLAREEAHAIDEAYAPAYNTQGLIRLRKGDVTGAMASFREAVSLDPGLVDAQFNLAALSLGTRNYSQAEDAFRAVLKEQPNNIDAVIGMGVAARGQRRLDEAEVWYRKGAQLNPRSCPAYFNLGLLYQDYLSARPDQLRTAREHFRTYTLCPVPDPEKAAEAGRRIKDIGGVIGP